MALREKTRCSGEAHFEECVFLERKPPVPNQGRCGASSWIQRNASPTGAENTAASLKEDREQMKEVTRQLSYKTSPVGQAKCATTQNTLAVQNLEDDKANRRGVKPRVRAGGVVHEGHRSVCLNVV